MLQSFNELENKNIIVKQLKSERGYEKDQIATLAGLGLKGVNTESKLKVTNSIYGMLNKVKHIIDVKIK